jgi:hypothetical protein
VKSIFTLPPLPPLALLALLAVSADSASAGISFTEVATSASAGIAGESYSDGSNHVGGACWVDYNNDDYPDLMLTNGRTRQSHLYKNDGDGTFTKVDNLLPDLSIDVGEVAGCLFGDYDNDGDDDIYLMKIASSFLLFGPNLSDGPENLLLKNLWVENGNQTVDGQALFQEVAATAEVAGTVDPPLGETYTARQGMTGGWLDYDLDGCLDLYVGQMVLQGGGDPGNLDTLYRNECDGTFEDTTHVANPGTDETLLRPALAFIGAHLDGDLWPDMYVVNVHEPAPYFEDLLYLNNANGTFTETLDDTPAIGEDSGSGMGIDTADIDLNGTWDIYITDFGNSTNDQSTGNVLYLGNGDGTFQENDTDPRGVHGSFSWGTNFFDADHDGDEDLVVGHKEKLFYRNNGSGYFTRLETGIFDENHVRGTAVADYDRDGDLDIVVVHSGKPPFLFRNDSTEIGNWLQVKLTGTQSNRSAINALVVITIGSDTQMRQVKGGSSAHSQDDLIVHFGVGSATIIDSVEVFWPHTDGTVDELLDVAVNQLITLTEGETTPSCLIDTDLTLTAQSIDTTELFEACSTITAGPDFHVLSGGEVTLHAGEMVTLRDGFDVGAGATLTVELD